MNYADMKYKDLSALAKELGVHPGGRPPAKTLVAALQPGGAPTAKTPEEQWEPTSQELYQFDRVYIVQKPFSGYEPGERVQNFARATGLMLVKEGSIKLDESSPRRSNPNAIARKPAQA